MSNEIEKNISDRWYREVERARDKARGLIDEQIAINQNTTVVIGKLKEVSIDKLWRLNYPYCKLVLQNPLRFHTSGHFDCKMGETEYIFINKPEMIMNMSEFQEKFPKISKKMVQKMQKERLW